jgi:alkylation response protein AidB-like acyl-CoA dehydrogenase
VHVALTEEQRMLVEVAREIAESSAFPGQQRLQEAPPVDASAWRNVVLADLVGLHTPEPCGGVAASALEVALVVEQFARARSVLPYLGTVLAVELLWRVVPETPELQRILAGECAGSVVLDPSLADLRSAGIAFDATPGGYAVSADETGVAARTTTTTYTGADLTRRLACVDADAPTAARGAFADEDRKRFLAFALSLGTADLLGAMDGTLVAAVAHAREREQFGQPIGSFQAIQQLCAEQLVLIESTRSAMWYAAWAVDELDVDEALLAARVAKAYAAGAAQGVCEAAIQVWGGLGFTWEYPAHVYLRRVLLSSALFGDEVAQLAAIAAARVSRRN